VYVTYSVHVLTTFLKLRKIPEVLITRFELTVGRRKTCMESSYFVISRLPFYNHDVKNNQFNKLVSTICSATAKLNAPI